MISSITFVRLSLYIYLEGRLESLLVIFLCVPRGPLQNF